ncbi:hypothetical protein A0130_02585 [Leifsonia xyli]|uniref:hypothetical protein n=1 Tax=Leifsonia xyli TaxID=1575 RepID=UPI0007CDBE28|nr:hypothetical protein A0130_02585 [Leifsonia xyli]
MFTRTARVATAVLLVAGLAGCSAQTVTTASTPTVKATTVTSPTPTPTPTPTVMTTAEAAALYKASACAVNTTGQAFNTIWQGNSGDIDGLRAAAAAARDASSATATKLDQATWPGEVKDDIAVVRDADFAAASTLSQIATATSWEAAIANQFPIQDAASAASQRIRSRLGLPADPMACS